MPVSSQKIISEYKCLTDCKQFSETDRHIQVSEWSNCKNFLAHQQWQTDSRHHVEITNPVFKYKYDDSASDEAQKNYANKNHILQQKYNYAIYNRYVQSMDKCLLNSLLTYCYKINQLLG